MSVIGMDIVELMEARHTLEGIFFPYQCIYNSVSSYFALDNITFFNGVFQNVESVTLFFGKYQLEHWLLL